MIYQGRVDQQSLCVLNNPQDHSDKTNPITWSSNSNAVLRNNQLTAVITRYHSAVQTTESKHTGKWYWEITINKAYGNMVGIIGADQIYTVCYYDGRLYKGICGNVDDQIVGYTDIIYDNEDIIGLALDLNQGQLHFYKNGVKINVSCEIPTKKAYSPCIVSNTYTTNFPVATANFGSSHFKYQPPHGFLSYQNVCAISSPISLLLEMHETAQLSVFEHRAENQNVTWLSLNPDIAMVGKNGIVTAKSPGHAVIQAEKPEAGFGEQIHIKVVPKGKTEQLRLALDLKIDSTAQLYFSGHQMPEWLSMSPDIVAVNHQGKMTALSPGLAIIEAKGSDIKEFIYVRAK